VKGLFAVAFIGLLMLSGRGYHTLLLILIGVLFVIGALTYTYDRSTTLEGLALCASIGLLSLIVQGRHPLVLVIALTVLGIGTLVFLSYDGRHAWSWWFPDEPFGPTVKRWLRYLLQAVAAAFAYVQARFYINELTGVDPGNFPTALTALAVLNTLVMWVAVLPSVMFVMAVVYAGMAYIAGLWGEIGLAEIGGISAGRWGFRAFGATCFMMMGLALALALALHPWSQRAGRVIASTVLVATEFSYDRTCAVSSKDRLVALLKYRREMTTSLVSIAEGGPWRETRFTTGTCDQVIEP
jgi:hypothetical protein